MFNFCPFCGERISSREKNGFKCPNCKKSYFYNSKPTVGIIPFFNDQMLFSIRAIEPDKGFLDTIGGFLENGEDPREGGVREFLEETGGLIRVEELKFLGVVMSEYTFQGEIFPIINLIYAVELDNKEKFEPMDDVAELVWVSKGESLEKFKMNDFMRKVLTLIE